MRLFLERKEENEDTSELTAIGEGLRRCAVQHTPVSCRPSRL